MATDIYSVANSFTKPRKLKIKTRFFTVATDFVTDYIFVSKSVANGIWGFIFGGLALVFRFIILFLGLRF